MGRPLAQEDKTEVLDVSTDPDTIISKEEVPLSNDVKRVMVQFADHVHFTMTGEPLTKEKCRELVEDFDRAR